jgi:acetyl-CoA carboxylase biotin carboxylase subunit
MADVERGFCPWRALKPWQRSATAGFTWEKIIEKARHIEVQILGDGRRVLHCFERECSLQRRRQKSEEAPSFILPHSTREALCRSAVALAESVNYRGAGTIEYLDDDVQDQFYSSK